MSAEIVVHSDSEALASATAALFAQAAQDAIAARGLFAVALSGGSTPQRLFELLAQPPYANSIHWQHVHIFWADDRCVAPDKDGSNYKQARLALLEHITIPAENIWRIRTELPCQTAVTDYIEQLASFTARHQSSTEHSWPTLDLALLGMGSDGHTASLFPDSPITSDQPCRLAEADYDGRPALRVTLTEPVLNAARKIVFLVAGAGKAEMINTVLVDEKNNEDAAFQYPVLRIRPKSQNLTFYLDSAAASLLPSQPGRNKSSLLSSPEHKHYGTGSMSENSQLDEIDRTLLSTLQDNARLSNAELARRVELSPSGLQKRLRRLEDQGLIQQYTAILNRQALGYGMLCVVHITLNRHTLEGINTFRDMMRSLDEVQECFQLTGNDDYQLKIIVRDVEHLEDFLSNTLTPIPAISRFRTSIVLKQVKSTTTVPVNNV